VLSSVHIFHRERHPPQTSNSRQTHDPPKHEALFLGFSADMTAAFSPTSIDPTDGPLVLQTIDRSSGAAIGEVK